MADNWNDSDGVLCKMIEELEDQVNALSKRVKALENRTMGSNYAIVQGNENNWVVQEASTDKNDWVR